MADIAEDTQHTCPDCAAAWTLPAGEREFFIDRGLNLPKRCPACRAARRLAKDQGLIQSPRSDPDTSRWR
jgi:hypothetical protein